MKLFTLLFCLMLATPALADDFEAGERAYGRGDYATALKHFKPLATQGDVWAQAILGVMYQESKGVRQDYSQAAKWYRKAAEQGLAVAQYNLGVMYGSGQGVAQDSIKAYMWIILAASAGDTEAKKARRIVAKTMTPSQLAQAQKMARECLAYKYKGC